MKKYFLGVFGFLFLSLSFSQPVYFQGRTDLSSQISNFSVTPPQIHTLYLLSGSAESVQIVSKNPWTARVVCLQAVWGPKEQLHAYRALLVFHGDLWKSRVIDSYPVWKAPGLVYPNAHLRVFAVYTGQNSASGLPEFDVLALRDAE